MKKNYLEASKQYKGFHYSILSQIKLDYIHNKNLEMLKEILQIFELNEIDYFIEGGTLLGAVTLNGFIPWDDDLDLCVFEDQYDMAIDLLIENLSDEFLVQCNKTEPHYFHSWVKVRDNYSTISPKIDCYKNNGVWCDIYKVIKTKKKDIEKGNILEHIRYLKQRGIAEKKKIYFFYICIKRHLFSKLFIEELKSLFFNSNEMVYQICSASRMVIPLDWVYPLKKYQFQGLEVNGIKDATKYLRSHYGDDYDKFPKENLRRISISDVKIIERLKGVNI